MMLHKLIFLLILVFTFGSCRDRTFDNKSDYFEYINNFDNGYHFQKQINDISYEVLLKPTDMMVLQELGNDSLNKNKYNDIRKKYHNNIYINLSLSKKSREVLSVIPKTKNEYARLNNTLLFGMKDFTHLFNSDYDTIGMVDYIYPKMYGMSKASTLMFVFEKDSVKLNTKHIYFSIRDFGLNSGEVRFKIDTKKLLDQPKFRL